MNSRICLLVLLLLILIPRNLSGQEKYRLTWEYKNLSFRDFVIKTENLHQVKFFYKEEWVKDLILGDYGESVTLHEVLDNLLRETNIYYFIDDAGNIVLTKNFVVKIIQKVTVEEGNFIPPTEYADYQDNKQSTGNIFIEIGDPADRNKPGNVIISGYITDRDTKEPVSGVTVYNQKLLSGTISNQYGFYSLSIPRGNHLLQFTFIGMKEKMINVNLYGSGEVNIEMNSMLIPLKETVVSAQKSMTLQRFEVGMEKINITSFRLLPTSMGESDIIKSILLIPGVQSVGEGSAGFNVRGGSADQNLILLYGAPVYNSSHFFGFFSAVNSDIIRDATLYKGGIPSKYGGRISSVLDIGTKEGNRKEFFGNAGISPITTHLLVEGPLIKDTCFFMLTGRTTYSNWIFKLIDNPALKRSGASFYDLNGKLTYDINKNNKIEFSSYLSHDAFRFNSDTVYSYNNNILALRWKHFFSSRFITFISLNNSNYNYNISSESVVTEGFKLSHEINSTGFKADFNWFQGRNEVNFGLDLTRYAVSPGSYMPTNDSSLIIPNVIEKEKALETAFYVDDKFVLTDYISINMGVRLSSFFTLGPREVMIYDPEFSKSSLTVTDTLHFKSNKIIKSYAGPEFRASLNFRVTGRSSFKINYNRTRQYLHLLSNTTSISPTDTWKLSDYYLKPQIGDQFALGFYQMLFKNSVETSAEIYYKEIKNMVDFKGGTRLVMNENIEKDIVDVSGKAYGLELMLKKPEGKLRWSIAYTYSRTYLKSIGSYIDEIINSGKWFPANFDKPNDLIITFNYLFSRRFSFSTNYTWSTGRPITYPVSSYHYGDILLIHYSERNKYRIPDYMRLDLSFRITGNLRSRKIAHPYWTFSVYNLLGRQNVYSIYFRNEKDIVKGYKLSVFGKAIPSLTFSFDF
ncbi:MAG TPA: TonB-dependent receptor [Bacteroidales bacterium]|nr:TonB-dependent receptor [Bacteroidales bacterium]